MVENKFYPTIADLVEADLLPDDFGILRSKLIALLEKIFYDNLQVNNSGNHNSGNYDFDIVTCRQLKIMEIPGTGISLIINPDENLLSQESRFHINFSYNWEVLRFIHNFKLSNFDFSVNSFYNLIVSSYNLDEKILLEEVIAQNLEGGLDEFVIPYYYIQSYF